MKFSVTVAAAILPLLVAAQVPGAPECAQPCLEAAIAASDCDASDVTCQCSESGRAAIQAEAAPCVLEACTPEEVQQALGAAEEACAAVQPTVTDDQTASETDASTTVTETEPTTTETESTTVSTDDGGEETSTTTEDGEETTTQTSTDAEETTTTTSGGGDDGTATTTADGGDATSTSQALGNNVVVGSTGGVLAAILGAFMIL